jgi:uncharacterized membrane-anchored protein
MKTDTNTKMKPERRVLSKVPEVAILFWIIKVLSTGMGETTSDFLIHRVGLANTTALAAIALVTGFMLAVCLTVQLLTKRYVPWIYWLAVVMVSIFGTMAADGVHAEMGIPYLVSTVVFSIVTSRREVFYWATVLTTFALGTAAGDMTAFTFHLGFLASGLLFAVLIAIPAIGFWKFGLAEVFAFWFAYIVTRPLGASFSDWVAAPKTLGGLGVGFGPVSLVLGIAIIALVGYLSVSQGSAISA